MKINTPLPKRASNPGIKAKQKQKDRPPAFYIGVSFKIPQKEGGFTILEPERSDFVLSRVMKARNSIQVTLAGIAELLESEAKHGPAEIYVHDERIEAYLNNGQLEIWAQNDWKAFNKKPLKYGDLYQRIHRAKEGRSVCVFLDRDHPAILEAKAKSLSAVNEELKPLKGRRERTAIAKSHDSIRK